MRVDPLHFDEEVFLDGGDGDGMYDGDGASEKTWGALLSAHRGKICFCFWFDSSGFFFSWMNPDSVW